MELANIMLRVGGDGFTIVPMFDVTPAECLLLNEIHAPADHDAVTEVDIHDDEDERSKLDEFERLRGKYLLQPLDLFRTLFGASGAAIPLTFAEAGLAPKPEPIREPTIRKRTNIDLSAKKYAKGPAVETLEIVD